MTAREHFPMDFGSLIMFALSTILSDASIEKSVVAVVVTYLTKFMAQEHNYCFSKFFLVR